MGGDLGRPLGARRRRLVCLPNRMVMLIGQAWLPPGAEVTPDPEHDRHAWWPRDVGDWPAEAHSSLCQMARLLEP